MSSGFRSSFLEGFGLVNDIYDRRRARELEQQRIDISRRAADLAERQFEDELTQRDLENYNRRLAALELERLNNGEEFTPDRIAELKALEPYAPGISQRVDQILALRGIVSNPSIFQAPDLPEAVTTPDLMFGGQPLVVPPGAGAPAAGAPAAGAPAAGAPAAGAPAAGAPAAGLTGVAGGAMPFAPYRKTIIGGDQISPTLEDGLLPGALRVTLGPLLTKETGELLWDAVGTVAKSIADNTYRPILRGFFGYDPVRGEYFPPTASEQAAELAAKPNETASKGPAGQGQSTQATLDAARRAASPDLLSFSPAKAAGVRESGFRPGNKVMARAVQQAFAQNWPGYAPFGSVNPTLVRRFETQLFRLNSSRAKKRITPRNVDLVGRAVAAGLLPPEAMSQFLSKGYIGEDDLNRLQLQKDYLTLLEGSHPANRAASDDKKGSSNKTTKKFKFEDLWRPDQLEHIKEEFKNAAVAEGQAPENGLTEAARFLAFMHENEDEFRKRGYLYETTNPPEISSLATRYRQFVQARKAWMDDAPGIDFFAPEFDAKYNFFNFDEAYKELFDELPAPIREPASGGGELSDEQYQRALQILQQYGFISGPASKEEVQQVLAQLATRVR